MWFTWNNYKHINYKHIINGEHLTGHWPTHRYDSYDNFNYYVCILFLLFIESQPKYHDQNDYLAKYCSKWNSVCGSCNNQTLQVVLKLLTTTLKRSSYLPTRLANWKLPRTVSSLMLIYSWSTRVALLSVTVCSHMLQASPDIIPS